METFLRGVCGPDYRSTLEHALPGAYEQALTDAVTFFSQDQPAVDQWSFTRRDASRIIQPALAVLGAKSPEASPIFREKHERLLVLLPNAEPFVLSEATHLLQIQNPRGMAEELVSFFAHHPLDAST